MKLFPSVSAWFIVSLSTLAAGSVSAWVTTAQQPWAIVFGSGLGALGASAITQSQKQRETTTNPSQLDDILANIQNQLNQALEKQAAPGPEPITQPTPVIVTEPTEPSPSPGPLRTAIFYDIENLTRGYHSRQHQIQKVSVTTILEGIQALEVVGEVMVQRAYADWSHQGLASIRSELSGLGIKPMQFVNFNHEKKSNATDIQLAVDAVELVLKNPLIQCFVIVSGDGGFTSLASKLREYGKVVVGCSYSNAASKNLQAICHHFVQIPDPTEEIAPPGPPRPILKKHQTPVLLERPQWQPTAAAQASPATPPGGKFTAFKEDCFRELRPIQSQNPTDAVHKIRELLDVCFEHSPQASQFRTQGLNPSLIEPVLYDLIPNLKVLFLTQGLVKFQEFLRFACSDSPYCLGRNQHGVKLWLRTALPPDFSLESDLHPRSLHQVETYRAILATDFPILTATQAPWFKQRMIGPTALKSVALELLAQLPAESNYEHLVKKIGQAISPRLAPFDIKRTIHIYRAAGVVSLETDIADPNTRHLTLAPGITTLADMHQGLAEVLRAKLAAVLTLAQEAIDETVFASLLFPLDPEPLSHPAQS